MHLGGELLLERRDADHEILVEVGAEDRHEFEAFEQWIAVVYRLLENAVVESEPRKFATEIKGGIVERRYGAFRIRFGEHEKPIRRNAANLHVKTGLCSISSSTCAII